MGELTSPFRVGAADEYVMAFEAAYDEPTKKFRGTRDTDGSWLEAPASFGARLHLGTAAICVLGWERDVRVIDRWNET